VQNVTSAPEDGSAEVRTGTPEDVLSDPEDTLTIVAGDVRKLTNVMALGSLDSGNADPSMDKPDRLIPECPILAGNEGLWHFPASR
jgi:hypothetical protein